MGWLGWAPDLALDTPMPLIALALAGRREAWRDLIAALPAALGLGRTAAGRARRPLSEAAAAAINRAAVAKQIRVTLLAAEKKRRRAAEGA